jgi:hypothetical protein
LPGSISITGIKSLGYLAMKTICTLILLLACYNSFGAEYQIFNISQDLPMGDGKPLNKNYYLNIGNGQGVGSGTKLDVYRNISMDNPYSTSKRVHYKVKIGEVEIIHVDQDASIARLKSFNSETTAVQLEINSLMIGDMVKVSVK